MLQRTPTIHVGDLVIVYSGYGFMRPVIISPNAKVFVRDTSVSHNDMIGKPWGSRLTIHKTTVFLLRPTPELWTSSLPHRTQIIFTPDIAVILFNLNIQPGWRVLEAGTGSGSLTHSFARAVAPSGVVHTVEFHEGRQALALAEFSSHGLTSMIRSRVGDISIPATLADHPDGFFDTVFLDVPKPWEFFGSGQDRVLRGGGMFCGFSPCIEQVEKTCAVLRSSGLYVDLHTTECICRHYDVVHTTTKFQKRTREAMEADGQVVVPKAFPDAFLKPKDGQLGHTAFLTFARKLVQ